MPPFIIASTVSAARRTRGIGLRWAAPLCSLLGCVGFACSASTDRTSSDANQFARDSSVDSAEDDGGSNSPVLDGGCTLSAPNSEGACIVDQDCIGISGTVAGILPCTNGRCPPFCTRLPIPLPASSQTPIDGGARCSRVSGPLAEDASGIGPVGWCWPGQVCTPYDGQWGCCSDTGGNGVICVFALYGEGGSD